MKRASLSLAVVFVFLVLSGCTSQSHPVANDQGQNHPAATDQAQSKTYTGEIMDSQCAQMGSHDAMMKNEHLKTAKDCTLACVKMGGKFVLYDAANKAIYQLDDQDKAKEFAGQKVTVTGTFDDSSQTIHIETMEAGEGSQGGN